MDLTRLFQMFMKLFGAQLINKGIETGIDLAVGKGKDRKDMTAEERANVGTAKQTAKKARDMARLARRLWR
jgi:hypothetical protein